MVSNLSIVIYNYIFSLFSLRPDHQVAEDNDGEQQEIESQKAFLNKIQYIKFNTWHESEAVLIIKNRKPTKKTNEPC